MPDARVTLDWSHPSGVLAWAFTGLGLLGAAVAHGLAWGLAFWAAWALAGGGLVLLMRGWRASVRANQSAVQALQQQEDAVQSQNVQLQQRVQALEAQMQQAQEWRTVVDALSQHCIVSAADPAGRIVYANDMFSQISGYSNTELLGQNHRIVKSNHQPEGFWGEVWKTISSGYVWRGEVCNRTKAGTPYWVDTIIAPHFGAQGIEKYVSVRFDVTQRVRAQQALDAERARLANIIVGTRAGTWEWNCQTGAGVVNARWAEMLGYSLPEVEADPNRFWRAALHPDDLLEAGRLLQQHLHGDRELYEFEGRIRHKDGHWIWQLTRGKVFTRSADGRPEWMAGISLDISESKRAQSELQDFAQTLRENAGFLARAGRIAGIGRWQVDLADHSVQWSDQTCHIHDVATGYRPTLEEAFEFFPPDAQAQMRDAVAAAMRTGKPWDMELPLKTAMARQIWVRCAGEAEYRDGRRIRLVGIFQDITQRHQLQEEVRQKNALMHNILLNIPVGLSVIDADLRLVAENPLFRQLLDFPDHLFTSSVIRFENFIRFNAERGEYGPGEPEVLVQEMLKKARHPEAHRFQRRRGDGRVLDIRGAPLQGGGFVSTYTDITDLTRALEAAQEASRSKSQFVANMSHEIRTPMNAVLGMLQLLHNTPLSEQQRDYAQKAEGAARSLLALLNDVLDFSKIEAGKMALDPQSFAPEQLLRSLAVILAGNVQGKSVEVLFDIDAQLPALMRGDAQRLQQVLINLAGNAIKFTPVGHVVLRWVVLDQQAATVHMRLAVHDSGIGIAPEHQQRIFEGFSQAETSTTRRFGGTGLGLSICRRLVALMGGQLQLDSRLGQGSTFSFELTMPLEAPAESGPIQDLWVLLVDDNESSRAVLATQARSLGWTVECAHSGAQAIQCARARHAQGSRPYDVLVLDWHMPDLDGWQTLHSWQQVHGLPMPQSVIMVTGQGRLPLQRRSADEQNRVQAVLVKPFTTAQLREAVGDARSGVRQLRSQTRAPEPAPRRLENLHLLVAEDNPINQQVARELLAREGAQVEVAPNGARALEALAQASVPFDAVLMDIQMPVMDGFEATQRIRADLGQSQLPIIAMTANALASDRAACLRAGMNAHVGKPFDLNELVAVIRRFTMAEGSKASDPKA